MVQRGPASGAADAPVEVGGAGPTWWAEFEAAGWGTVVQCLECGRLLVPRVTNDGVFPRRHRAHRVSRPWCAGSNQATTLTRLTARATQPTTLR